ncbi:MAG: copper homeostasis protein CutC [Filimonas sp.]|nr:copper homeostasis protein CutC [Filimonas sp.]
MKYTLEIAVFNITAAINAANAGADRIELCENGYEGGTTPSYGTLKQVIEKISIPVFPIIRPRGGDFLYSADEFSCMLADVQLCKELGYTGVVLGLLNADGTIDKKRTSQLTALAYPMEVTFHRAFDRCVRPLEALTDVIDAGCQRILTSGQFPEAPGGIALIKQLVTAAQDDIIIMPGSGVRSNNIVSLLQETGAVEIHSSARTNIPSSMEFICETMQEDLSFTGVSKEEVRKMKDIMNGL